MKLLLLLLLLDMDCHIICKLMFQINIIKLYDIKYQIILYKLFFLLKK